MTATDHPPILAAQVVATLAAAVLIELVYPGIRDVADRVVVPHDR